MSIIKLAITVALESDAGHESIRQLVADIQRLVVHWQSEATANVDVTTGLDAQLDMSADDLEFSVRTSNVLRNVGCYTVGDIIKHDRRWWLSQANFGRKSLNEMIEGLAYIGLSLAAEPATPVVVYRSNADKPMPSERNVEIVRMVNAGMAQKDVATAFGITGARVNQIFQKNRRRVDVMESSA